MKRALHKIHKFLVEFITLFFGIAFVLSICALDSETWIPFFVLIVSGLWLAAYAWANGWFYSRKGR